MKGFVLVLPLLGLMGLPLAAEPTTDPTHELAAELTAGATLSARAGTPVETPIQVAMAVAPAETTSAATETPQATTPMKTPGVMSTTVPARGDATPVTTAATGAVKTVDDRKETPAVKTAAKKEKSAASHKPAPKVVPAVAPVAVATTETASDPIVPPASVAAPAPAAEPLPFADGAPQFSLLRTLGGMGIVLSLMGIAYFVMRKYAPGVLPKGSAGRHLKIIETLNMGDKRSLALIEAGGSVYLIGSTPQQINMLAAMPENTSLLTERQENDAMSESGAHDKSGFRKLFEVEKKRPVPRDEKILPDDIRIKMRRLREALEK